MRKNALDGFSQFGCCPMKGAGCLDIVDILAITSDNGALACLYHREQRDFIGTPIEKHAAFAAMLRPQDACFYQRAEHLCHIGRRFTQLESDAAWRRNPLLIFSQAEKGTSCQK